MSKQAGLSDDEVHVIKRNSDMVYRLAFSQMKNKEDTDDVYQEVFLRYIKYRVDFKSPEHEKAWFIRVTLNCCKTVFSSFWRTKVTELDDNFETAEIDTDDLSYALEKLPKKYNAVLHLFYYEDLSVEDIAEILKISQPNVRMLLTRARRKLKEIIEKEQS
ncbi:MAG: sigma-70 family RNA polymerase sigma factor [Clostridia bacterium]|nr:sigma-70 family RNA polymerase sigma factor [Clostridia bacterium]